MFASQYSELWDAYAFTQARESLVPPPEPAHLAATPERNDAGASEADGANAALPR